MAAKEGDENIGRIMAAKAPAIIRELSGMGDDPKCAGRPVIHDPSLYQAEIATRLCSGESLQQMCADIAMPSLRTVNRWIAADTDFADAVRNARAIGVHALMDAAVNIASGGCHSTGSIERDKLLCSVLKWIVAKRDPDNAPHVLAGRQIFITIDDENAHW